MPDQPIEQVAPDYRPPGPITILGDQPQPAAPAPGGDLASRFNAHVQQQQAGPAATGGDLASRFNAHVQQQQGPAPWDSAAHGPVLNAAHSIVSDTGGMAADTLSGVMGGVAHVNHLVANASDLMARGVDALSAITGLSKEHLLHSVADWARQSSAEQQQGAQRWAGGRQDFASQMNRGLIQGAVEAPLYMAAGHVAGPVAGMGLLGGLDESDKGVLPAVEGTAKGMLTGAAYHMMGPAAPYIRAPTAAALAYAEAVLRGEDPTSAAAKATTAGLQMLPGEAGGAGFREMARNAPDVHIPALFPNRNPQKRAAAQYMQDVVGANVNAGTASGNVGLQFLQKGVDVSPIGSYITAKETSHNIEKQRAHADYLIEQAKPETPAADHYKAIYDIADDPSSAQSVPTGRKDAEGNPVMADVQMPVNVGQFKPAMQEIVDLYSFAPGADKSISGALSTAETILSSPNHIPLKTAEVGLSSLKEEAMSGTGRAAGLAKSLVPRLQAAIDASARDIGGPEAVEHLQEARAAAGKEAGSKWLSDQFQLQMREGEFERAQRILNKWNDMNPAEKRAKFRDPEQVSAISNFLLGNKMLAQNPNPSGTGPLLVAQSQLGLLFYNPWTAAQTIIGTGAMSKLFHSRFGVQLLTEGMHTNPNSPRGRQIGGQINAIISPGGGGTPPPQPGAAPDEPPGGGAPPEDEGGAPPPPPPPGAPPGGGGGTGGGAPPGHLESGLESQPTVSLQQIQQGRKAREQGFIDQAKAAGGQEPAETEQAPAKDPLYDQAVALAREGDRVSTSQLQRRLGLGYGAAVRMLDRMEQDGIVGSADGSKPREVLPQEEAGGQETAPPPSTQNPPPAGAEASPEAQQAFLDKVGAARQPAEGQATAQPSLSERLQASGDEALQRMRDRGTFSGTKLNTLFPPEDLKDMAIWGAAKIAKGTVDFAKWSKEMIAELGPRVKPQLEGLYAKAQKIYASHVDTTANLLPDTTELLKKMRQGKAGKEWYTKTKQELVKMFGPDAEMMIDFLAVTSPNNTVAGNVTQALKAYRQWRLGQPFEGYLPIHKDLLNEVANDPEQAPDAGGLKVRSFRANLKGDPDAVTVDRWIRRAFNFTKPSITDPQYKFMDYTLTQIAKRAKMEPRQVQAAIWTAIKEADQKAGQTSLPFEELLPAKVAADPEMQALIARAKAGEAAPPRPRP